MAYSYYRTLTIDHTKCGSSDSSNFPVLVSINDVTFKDAAHSGHIQNSNGYDIIFTSDSAGATKIPWEIEFYDNVNGVLVAWVNIATVSHTTDTVFYIFFGDATVSIAQNTGSYAPSNVWNSNYKGVWHLGDASSSTVSDSTSNANSGAVTNLTAATGKIKNCAYSAKPDDSGTGTQKIVVTKNFYNIIGGSSAHTISFWLNIAYNSSHYAPIPFDGAAGVGIAAFFQVNTSGGGGWWGYNGSYRSWSSWPSIGSYLTPGTWYRITFVKTASGNNGDAYINGIKITTSGSLGDPPNSGSGTWFFNYAVSTYYAWPGSIDEINISNTNHSGDWILTEYNNQNAPGNIGADSFIKFGSESSTSTATPITESVSDTLSLSDGILFTNPVIVELVYDSLSLSDTVTVNLISPTSKLTFDSLSLSDSIITSNTIIRITQEVAEVVTEDAAAAIVRTTQLLAEVVIEDTKTAVVRVTQIAIEVVTEDFPTGTYLVSDVLSLSDSILLSLTIITGVIEIAPTVLEQANGILSFPGLWENVSIASESGTGTNEFNGLLEYTPSIIESGEGLTYENTPAIPGVTQALIEVAAHQEQDHSPPSLIITQNIIEWAKKPHTNLFITQVLIEWAIHSPNVLVATQVCIEVAHKFQNGPVKAHYKRILPL